MIRCVKTYNSKTYCYQLDETREELTKLEKEIVYLWNGIDKWLKFTICTSILVVLLISILIFMNIFSWFELFLVLPLFFCWYKLCVIDEKLGKAVFSQIEYLKETKRIRFLN